MFSRKKPVDFVPGVPDPPDDSAEDSPSDSPDEARGYRTAQMSETQKLKEDIYPGGQTHVATARTYGRYGEKGIL
jgi:hypothetical protein